MIKGQDTNDVSLTSSVSSAWLTQISVASRPIRTSLRVETSGGVAKWRLFSQASFHLAISFNLPLIFFVFTI